MEWAPGLEPYYPINDTENNRRYAQYKKLAGEQNSVIFGGRLGKYCYYDMDKVVRAALDDVATMLGSMEKRSDDQLDD